MRRTNLKTARRACVALALGLLLLAPAFGPAPRVESPAAAGARVNIAPTVSEWLRRPLREEFARALRSREAGPGGEQLAMNAEALSQRGAR